MTRSASVGRRRIAISLLFMAALASLTLSVVWRGRQEIHLPAESDSRDLPPRVETVIREARAGVRGSPRSPTAWGRLGMIYWAHGLSSDAITCLEEAVRLGPGTFRWRYYVAVLREQHDLALADREYSIASTLDPGYAPLHCRHGDLLTRLNRKADAEEKYRAAAEYAPESPYPHLALGRLAVSAHNLEAAEKHFAAAATVGPWSRDAHFERANVLRRLGEISESDREMDRARSLPEFRTEIPDPLREEVAQLDLTSRPLAFEADRAIAQGNLSGAIPLLRRLIEERPDLARPRLNLGQILESQGEFSQAILVLHEAVETFPREPLARFALAQALEAAGEVEASLESYRQATSLKPDYLDALLEQGRILMQRDDLAAATDVFRKAVSAEPGSAKAHRALGECLYRSGDQAGARLQFRVALRLEPRWRELQERLDGDDRVDPDPDVRRRSTDDSPRESSNVNE